VILVETVGVGQSEYEVAAMVDFFLVLMLPNAGDELQGIKRGIMELADALVINKADGESVNLAKQTQSHYKNALHLLSQESFWEPQVKACSARENIGITEVWDMISEFEIQAKDNGHFKNHRAKQSRDWLKKLIQEMLELKLKQNSDVKKQLPQLQQDVLDQKIPPYNAAQHIIKLL
jgi:LAO/AO transport system kinase